MILEFSLEILKERNTQTMLLEYVITDIRLSSTIKVTQCFFGHVQQFLSILWVRKEEGIINCMRYIVF
jgi:hypothetical protein